MRLGETRAMPIANAGQTARAAIATTRREWLPIWAFHVSHLSSFSLPLWDSSSLDMPIYFFCGGSRMWDTMNLVSLWLAWRSTDVPPRSAKSAAFAH
jgi:hypothetical protein